ncbi:rhodanese-like domain-containing protein [Cyanobium sp. ATX-6F1]|uniref:rhodanese-like domain-containing protein n=1 Tax=Cyanobium sp. ATX-6F1 TaxID=3137388 RepID=UPI0039BE4CA5
MTTTPTRLSAHDLADQLAAGEVTVVDVREPMEYASGHISGSLNIPLARLPQADLPHGPLVLVCQSGNRSAKGLSQLLRQGHPHPVADLLGGVPAWQQAGFSVRKLKGAPCP